MKLLSNEDRGRYQAQPPKIQGWRRIMVGAAASLVALAPMSCDGSPEGERGGANISRPTSGPIAVVFQWLPESFSRRSLPSIGISSSGEIEPITWWCESPACAAPVGSVRVEADGPDDGLLQLQVDYLNLDNFQRDSRQRVELTATERIWGLPAFLAERDPNFATGSTAQRTLEWDSGELRFRLTSLNRDAAELLPRRILRKVADGIQTSAETSAPYIEMAKANVTIGIDEHRARLLVQASSGCVVVQTDPSWEVQTGGACDINLTVSGNFSLDFIAPNGEAVEAVASWTPPSEFALALTPRGRMSNS
jgi:hypothetical protein